MQPDYFRQGSQPEPLPQPEVPGSPPTAQPTQPQPTPTQSLPPPIYGVAPASASAPKPKKKLPVSALIGIIVGVIALVIATVLIVLVVLNNHDSGDKLAKSYPTYSCDLKQYSREMFGTKVYCYAEQPHYGEWKALFDDTESKVDFDKVPKDSNGSIKQYFLDNYNLNGSDAADFTYMTTMQYVVTDYKASVAVSKADWPFATNAKELDATLQENIKNLKEVYNRFRAHKDLGVSVDIGINAPYTIASTGVTISTKVDGKDRFISDGKYTGTRKGVDNYTPQEDTVTAQDGTQQPIAPSAPSTGSTNLSELEQWSTNFQPASTCDDGTYVCDLQTYVGKFGMVLDFNFDKIYDGCYGSPSGDDQYVVAAYCHATPTKIFINDKYAGYPDDLKDIYIVDAVKHEMAHHLIGMICNTSSPAILGRMTEAATSSYAVLFLGASRERLSTGVPPEYQMSTKTDNLAHQIHDDKKCS